MPTRTQKLHAYTLWRVTAPGSSGAQLQKKFRSGGINPGLQLRGGSTVHVETTNKTYIVIRWNPPRKYDTVKRLLQTVITEFDIEPVDPPPVPDASAALDASSAQPARLPGGFFSL